MKSDIQQSEAAGFTGRLGIQRRTVGTLGVVGMVWLALLTGCSATESAQPVATNEVSMPPSYRFDPVAIQIPAGTTVTWRNTDNFTHSVKIGDGEAHSLKPGESVALPFATTGTFNYICTYHAQNMKGTVVVTSP